MIVDQLLEFITNHKKAVLVSVAAMFVVVSGIVITVSLLRAGKVAVEVRIVPQDSVATATHSSSRVITKLSSGTVYLPPGQYTVEITKPGWRNYSGSLTVSSDHPARIAIGLIPESDEAKKWMVSKSGEAAFKGLEVAGAKNSEERADRLIAKYPILQDLPITDPYYTINYAILDEAQETIELRVTTESPYYRREAMRKLRDLGYKLGDYVISFDNYVSPLGVAK